MTTPVYAIDGTRTVITATRNEIRFETKSRARRYAGTAASDITNALTISAA